MDTDITLSKYIDRINELERRLAVLEAQDATFPQLQLVDGVSVPTTTSGVATIYVNSSNGDLAIKFGDGTIKTIVTD